MFRDMITADPSISNMRKVFRQSEMPGLYDSGMAAVKKGITTIEEVLRVTEVYGIKSEEVFVENIA